MAKSIVDDSADVDELWKRIEAIVCLVRFENLLAFPVETSARVDRFLGLNLDVNAMAACVRPRSDRCADDMSMEMALIEARA